MSQLGSTITGSGELLAVGSLQEFFHDSVCAAARNQNVDVGDHATHYVVNVLTFFSRAERLYEHTDNNLGIRPLALMFGDAFQSKSARQRDTALQRLGDVALFVAGFFAGSFKRRLVGIEYFMRMGGSAYRCLADSRDRPVFDELSEKFVPLVDVLNEVSEMCPAVREQKLIDTYERWLATGSERCATLLRQQGIEPVRPANSGSS